jgi:hypothetical protein
MAFGLNEGLHRSTIILVAGCGNSCSRDPLLHILAGCLRKTGHPDVPYVADGCVLFDLQGLHPTAIGMLRACFDTILATMQPFEDRVACN